MKHKCQIKSRKPVERCLHALPPTHICREMSPPPPPLCLENVCVCFKIRACLSWCRVYQPWYEISAFTMWFYLAINTRVPALHKVAVWLSITACQQRGSPCSHIKKKEKENSPSWNRSGTVWPWCSASGSRIQTSPPSWSWLISPLIRLFPPLQSSCLSSLSSLRSILSSNPACHRLSSPLSASFLDCARPSSSSSSSSSLVYLWLCSHGDGHGCHSDHVTTRTASSEKRGNKGFPMKRCYCSQKALSRWDTHTHTRTRRCREDKDTGYTLVKEQIRIHTWKCANKQARTVCWSKYHTRNFLFTSLIV